MDLHADVPFVSLLCLVYFRVTFARLILCGKRRSDDCGVNNRALLKQQALCGKVTVDGVEYDLGEAVRLQQTVKLQLRGGIGRGVDVQINADKPSNCLAVVDRIFHAFSRQAKALLNDVHAQHAR